MTHCPVALRRSVLTLGAALAIAYLSSCGRTTVRGGVPAGPDVFIELEPNDSPAFPDFVGVLNRNSYLAVQGRVEAVGFDIVDHIEFETSEPMELDFLLTALDPLGNVDVTIYDPIADLVLGTYTFDDSFEEGTIIVDEPGRPFQFIITAVGFDTDWDLEIIGFPHSCGSCLTQPLAGTAAVDGEGAEERSWIEVRGASGADGEGLAPGLD